jgi:hypothetical protein
MGLETATLLAIGSIASSGATAGMSFAEAGKQRKLQKEAENEAAKALAEARKKLDVNYYANLGINKEPYELEREALVSAGAQAIQAGQESERGAAATAGRIQMAQQQGQRQIAGDMGAEMLNLDKLTAQEDSRLAGAQAGLYLGEAEGAQLAARDAQQAAAAYTTGGVQGIANAASQTLSSLVPLYSKTGLPVAGGAEVAGAAVEKNIPNQMFQNTLFGTSTPFGGAQGASPLNAFKNSSLGATNDQFQVPALNGIRKDQLAFMSKEELLKLLTGGK